MLKSRLRQLMDKRGMTYADTAKFLGVSVEQVRQQSNSIQLGIECTIRYARKFEIDPAYFRPDYFFEGECKFISREMPCLQP